MSHSEDHRDTGSTTIYYDGFEAGQKKIIDFLREKKALRKPLLTSLYLLIVTVISLIFVMPFLLFLMVLKR